MAERHGGDGRSRATDDTGAGSASGRPPRADARRNRERVLKAAMEAFAADGLSVPVHEIARRAGVGTGTVSRHFPTKEELYGAIVATVAHRLVEQANALADNEKPGPAFFAFFALMVEEGAVNRGLSEALAGAGFDVEAAASSADHDVMAAFATLLQRAQSAGAVRRDVDIVDVKALMIGCLARDAHPTGPDDRNRMIDVVCEGLHPKPHPQAT